MGIRSLNAAVILCLILPLAGCVLPYWDPLSVVPFTLAPDGKLSGRAQGSWTHDSVSRVLKPGDAVKMELRPVAALCQGKEVTTCVCEGRLVRLEVSEVTPDLGSGQSVNALVVTVTALSVRESGRKNPTTPSVPTGEVRVPVADIHAFRLTKSGVCLGVPFSPGILACT
jgi:hypothetical protein